MASEIDILELAKAIRAKRGTRGLRAIADEIGGVSASTLSRIEQGKIPDLDTFIRLCRWLGVSADHFTDKSSHTRSNEPEIISLHFRADRTLDPKTAKALLNMIQMAIVAVDEGHLSKQEDKHATRVQKVG